MNSKHLDPHIDHLLVQLNDALCTWERSTGRQSVLILREQHGFEHRSVNGKPCVVDDVDDRTLLNMVKQGDQR